jgi:ADP-ribosylglycohydrolase
VSRCITAALAGAVALTRATEQREQAEIDEQLAEELYERSLAVLAKALGDRQMDD